MLPEMPAEIPRKGNSFTRWLGQSLLKILGWKVTGEFPRQSKVVVAVAPHTSNWDFIVGAAGIMAVGIRVHFLMKQEAFFWPMGKFFRWLGGVPVDRAATLNTVDQIVNYFHSSEKLWVAIAPEGTRKKVTQWKTGFLRVAQQADVPVLLVAWDYSKKEFVLDQLWYVKQDIYKECADIQQYINSTYQGRYPNQQ